MKTLGKLKFSFFAIALIAAFTLSSCEKDDSTPETR